MQVSGRLLVLATFAIGLAMAAGAWWYNYRQSLQSARFWGAEGARLIVGAETVELVTLAPNDEAAEGAFEDRITGLTAADRFDLSRQRGLVHLRHALAFDANFAWDELERDAPADVGWTRALRFAQGERELVILFSADFTRLGRVAADGRIDALPCPRLGPSIVEYLGRVGAPGYGSTEAANVGGTESE